MNILETTVDQDFLAEMYNDDEWQDMFGVADINTRDYDVEWDAEVEIDEIDRELVCSVKFNNLKHCILAEFQQQIIIEAHEYEEEYCEYIYYHLEADERVSYKEFRVNWFRNE